MQSETLVIQSHRQPLPLPWLSRCMQSVEQWSESKQYDYRFIDDELFSKVPDSLNQKFAQQKVILTDLARLLWLREAIEAGYQTVIWCDADFLIIDPESFHIIDESYALGREVWVQHDKKGKLKAYKKVHNAFLMFREGNSFLDFWIDTSLRLLNQAATSVPPQFIGPKLLTALHNVVQCPVQETAGMLSPLVLKDLLEGSGDALELFKTGSEAPVFGANLSSSVAHQDGLTEAQIERLIDHLVRRKAF